MTLLVGTDDGLFLFEPGAQRRVLEGRMVSSLVHREGGWWAVADGTSILREATEDPAVVTALDDHRLNCLLVAGTELLAGTSEARLFRLGDGGLEPVTSFDSVPGREDWYTPWGGPPDVRSMSLSPDGVILVNVHVGGIPVSPDGGQTWRATIEVDADVHQVLADPSRPGRVLAATAHGLAESTDRGGSWEFLAEGLHAAYARAVALAGQTVLLTASTGPRGGRAAIYRRPGATGFVRCTDGLPEWFASNIDTQCLAAAGATAAFGTDEGSVYLSGDAGETWELVAEGLPPVRAVAVG